MEKINPQPTIMRLDMVAFYAAMEVLGNAAGSVDGDGCFFFDRGR